MRIERRKNNIGYNSFLILLDSLIIKKRSNKDNNKVVIMYYQEAHGPQVAQLSDITTADMQMLCLIFPTLSSQLMKRSSFKQFLILKKNIYGMTVNGA